MSTIEAEILSRIVAPNESTLDPQAARAILAFGFPASDREIMDQLAEKAREDTLSDSELSGRYATRASCSLVRGLKLAANHVLSLCDRLENDRRNVSNLEPAIAAAVREVESVGGFEVRSITMNRESSWKMAS